MKKLYKKIVSLVMSALLAVMVLPVTTHASNQQDNDIVCRIYLSPYQYGGKRSGL